MWIDISSQSSIFTVQVLVYQYQYPDLVECQSTTTRRGSPPTRLTLVMAPPTVGVLDGAASNQAHARDGTAYSWSTGWRCLPVYWKLQRAPSRRRRAVTSEAVLTAVVPKPKEKHGAVLYEVLSTHLRGKRAGLTKDRTWDLQIFSLTLSQLS